MSVRTMLPIRRILIDELCQRWVDRASRPHYREMLEKLSHESLVETYTLNVELQGAEKPVQEERCFFGHRRDVTLLITG
jgi:hypothetical protein